MAKLILTNETFRKSKLNPTANAAFFESGKADAQAFFNTCARNGIQPPKSGTVLDFGCGVGRVGYFLAHHFSGYVGVDISQPHLELAKQRLANQARKSQFFNLPDFLSSKMRYDAIYSVIVLQHNPPPIIMWLLERLLSSLTRKGVAYFQVPCSLIGYKFSLAEYLAATPSDAMEMHAIPQSAVFGIAERTNCRVLEVMPDGKASHIGTSFSFLLQKM